MDEPVWARIVATARRRTSGEYHELTMHQQARVIEYMDALLFVYANDTGLRAYHHEIIPALYEYALRSDPWPISLYRFLKAQGLLKSFLKRNKDWVERSFGDQTTVVTESTPVWVREIVTPASSIQIVIFDDLDKGYS
jgi:hypothetical protein